MSSRSLATMLRRFESAAPTLRQATTTTYTRARTALKNALHRLRTISPFPPPPPSCSPPRNVAGTIITELERANIRCTILGHHILQKAYAKSNYGQCLTNSSGFPLRWPLFIHAATKGLNRLTHLDVDAKGHPKWDCKWEFDQDIDMRVLKLWDALHVHSRLFRALLEREERKIITMGGDMTADELLSVHGSQLWWWLVMLYHEGVVVRGDVDELTEMYCWMGHFRRSGLYLHDPRRALCGLASQTHTVPALWQML
ncbi:hypothetical protein Dda_1526 [Drechslerella dactyloides]|uniref:Uncharacterized protein n=1 Tax=Drechslerella dactyloides TaxID=74499 RepID=A0AAD6J1Y4_DREDA|nr:hypothetical protein Dda_1526 [Drechslerella dactyloides]